MYTTPYVVVASAEDRDLGYDIIGPFATQEEAQQWGDRKSTRLNSSH